MNAIEVKNVSMRYGAVRALNDVSATFVPGKIYGLLGRNGAGKTTLINLITNRLFPSEGEITVEGQSVMENGSALNKIFSMTEQNLVPEGMRVKRAIEWTKEFYEGFDDLYALSLAQKFGLNVSKKMKQLSTGYSSIFKLILTMASGAPILIFDEPVLGLDAPHRELFYQELLALFAKRPCTVILSTHLIDEAAQVIEQAVILDEGRLILSQSVEELLSRAHSVAGEAAAVAEYCKNKQVIFEQSMGNFKMAAVLDCKKDQALAQTLKLEFGGIELQKLFIYLTNSQGGGVQ